MTRPVRTETRAVETRGYLSRRQLFVDALSSGDYPTSAIARTLRFVTVDLPSIRFEPREHLVNAAVDGVSDDEALQHFLVSMTEYSHLVHPILQRLATRADPFPLLVRLLRVPLLEAYRATLQRKFREAAGLRYVAFRAWVRANLDDFFDDLVFQPLIKRGTELLGALCKEIEAISEGTIGPAKVASLETAIGAVQRLWPHTRKVVQATLARRR